jgi:hypothetical protein
MALYPDILFHFTSKESLEKILGESFKVSYARERIHGGNRKKEFAVPMVSFSDLRLSELKQNIGTYGKFGIGLTKEWAIRNGLNPVMYASKESLFTENFLDGTDDLFKLVAKSKNPTGTYERAFNNTINTLRYLKNYKGDLIRTDKPVKKNYVFANEREWRYVPPISEQHLAFIPLVKIKTTEQKAEYNRKINHLHLSFKPDDIKYLIVEHDDDIDPLISHLRQVKHRFPHETVDRLASRILTYQQIENDI